MATHFGPEIEHPCGVSTAASELVWNGDGAVAVSHSGASLHVGRDWDPEALFSLGIEAELLMTFLQLAGTAGLGILGYVSSGRVVHEPDAHRRLTISICVVVGSPLDAPAVERLCAESEMRAPLAQLLGSNLHVELSIAALQS